MTTERPEWRPPAKDYGGVDLPNYYAGLLLGEVVASMCAVLQDFNLPIRIGMAGLSTQQKQVHARLDEKDQFFYPDKHSVITDYLIMKEKAFRRCGEETGEEHAEEASIAGQIALFSKFSPSMSTKKAFEVAKKIVLSWDWGEDTA